MATSLGLVKRIHVLHTDDLAKLGWSEASAEAALWFDDPEVGIIEGVAVPRALRKWLAANEIGTPCRELRWLGSPRIPLSKGQVSMGKGCATVLLEILGELQTRGVQITIEGELRARGR